MSIKKSATLIMLLACMCLSFTGTAMAVTQLPDPNTIIPGSPETIAFQYEDFYVYSARLNTALGYTGFDISTGTGHLDLLLYTGANGQTNKIPNQNPPTYWFEDPMDAPGGNATSFAGTWGAGNGPHGPVLVDNLVNYLHTTFGPTINVPVFDFDMNQIGADTGSDIYVAGKVSIWDPSSQTEIASWIFDSQDDGIFNPNDLVWVPGTELVASSTTGYAPPLYTFDNNLGSGHLDYIAVAPDMDLSQYMGHGYEFHGDFYLGGLTDGPEELYLTGQFAPFNPVVPEPSSMILMGVGLFGALRRRFRRNTN